MKRLLLPNFSARDAIELCATGITVAARAKALLDALPAIEAGETSYKQLGPLGQLFQLPASDNVTADLSGPMMGTIYKSHFARIGAPTRGMYDAIRLAPKFSQCPLCGQRPVGSVDHYLPQSAYPAFNLTPANLVPSCVDCNKAKLALVALTAEEQTIHPYFDVLGNTRWLVADVGELSPPAIEFRVRPAADWSEVLARRVEHHFRTMGLAVLYAAQGASELADIAHSLVRLGNAGGEGAVRGHLSDEYESRKASDINSWKTALYEGLRESDWFCTQGFRLIAT